MFFGKSYLFLFGRNVKFEWGLHFCTPLITIYVYISAPTCSHFDTVDDLNGGNYQTQSQRYIIWPGNYYSVCSNCANRSSNYKNQTIERFFGSWMVFEFKWSENYCNEFVERIFRDETKWWLFINSSSQYFVLKIFMHICWCLEIVVENCNLFEVKYLFTTSSRWNCWRLREKFTAFPWCTLE